MFTFPLLQGKEAVSGLNMHAVHGMQCMVWCVCACVCMHTCVCGVALGRWRKEGKEREERKEGEGEEEGQRKERQGEEEERR